MRRRIFDAINIASLLMVIALALPVIFRKDVCIDFYRDKHPRLSYSETYGKGLAASLGACLNIELHEWTSESETMAWFPPAWMVMFFFLLLPTWRLQVYLKEKKVNKKSLISN